MFSGFEETTGHLEARQWFWMTVKKVMRVALRLVSLTYVIFVLSVWQCRLESKLRKCDLLESVKLGGPAVLSDFSIWITVCVNYGHILTPNSSTHKNPMATLDRKVLFSFLVYIRSLLPCEHWLHLHDLSCWSCSLLVHPFAWGSFQQSDYINKYSCWWWLIFPSECFALSSLRALRYSNPVLLRIKLSCTFE